MAMLTAGNRTLEAKLIALSDGRQLHISAVEGAPLKVTLICADADVEDTIKNSIATETVSRSEWRRSAAVAYADDVPTIIEMRPERGRLSPAKSPPPPPRKTPIPKTLTPEWCRTIAPLVAIALRFYVDHHLLKQARELCVDEARKARINAQNLLLLASRCDEERLS
jgi:hypothetical protein